jgi:hypothetical protein
VIGVANPGTAITRTVINNPKMSFFIFFISSVRAASRANHPSTNTSFFNVAVSDRRLPSNYNRMTTQNQPQKVPDCTLSGFGQSDREAKNSRICGEARNPNKPYQYK